MSTTLEAEKLERKERAAERRLNDIFTPRVGVEQNEKEVEKNKVQIKGFELSGITWIDPKTLKPNPNNLYAPLDAEEMQILVEDIRDQGVRFSLIIREDKVIICGHNRRTAALTAGVDRVPVQYVDGKISAAEEARLMRTENDLRRGGKWPEAKKIKFVQENFFNEAIKDERGGDRKTSEREKRNEISFGEKVSIASRGKISPNTANRIKTELRKKVLPKKKPAQLELLTGVKAIKDNEKKRIILLEFHDLGTFNKAKIAIRKMAKTIFR